MAHVLVCFFAEHSEYLLEKFHNKHKSDNKYNGCQNGLPRMPMASVMILRKNVSRKSQAVARNPFASVTAGGVAASCAALILLSINEASSAIVEVPATLPRCFSMTSSSVARTPSSAVCASFAAVSIVSPSESAGGVEEASCRASVFATEVVATITGEAVTTWGAETVEEPCAEKEVSEIVALKLWEPLVAFQSYQTASTSFACRLNVLRPITFSLTRKFSVPETSAFDVFIMAA